MKRNNIRISLGGLLLLVTLVAMALSWYRLLELRRARLIDSIELAGGVVIYKSASWKTPFRGSRVIHMSLEPEHARTLSAAELLSFPSLEAIYIYDTELSGSWIQMVKRDDFESYLASHSETSSVAADRRMKFLRIGPAAQAP